jgi:hypothetical protein
VAATLHICERADRWRYQIWPTLEPIPAGTIQEDQTYRLVLSDVPDARDAELLVDDEPLKALRSRSEAEGVWEWNPGFFAGILQLEIRLPNGPTAVATVTVDPRIAKLQHVEFERMVSEILTDTLVLLSLSPFRFGVARGVGSDRPPIARLEFLRSQIGALEKLLHRIARRPQRILSAVRMVEDVRRARRVTGRDLVRSYRFGRVVPDPRAGLDPMRPQYLPAVVERRHKIERFQSREHAIIKAFIVAASSWCEHSAAILRAMNPDRASVTHKWSVRCSGMARRLTVLGNLEFLRDVVPASGPLELTEVFRRNADYRSVLAIIRNWRLGIARVTGEYLNVPLARTYDLYELWAYLRLVRAAVDEFDLKNLDLTHLFDTSHESGSVVLKARDVRLSLGKGRELCFQRHYIEYWRDATGTGSFSREMVPDVAYTDRERCKIVVFDAKYRTDTGISDAISSIHTYRDALVHSSEDERLTEIVAGAYILTPMLPGPTPDPWRDTSFPTRLFHPTYRATFRFGALTLRPGVADSEVRQVLRTALSDAGL